MKAVKISQTSGPNGSAEIWRTGGEMFVVLHYSQIGDYRADNVAICSMEIGANIEARRLCGLDAGPGISVQQER